RRPGRRTSWSTASRRSRRRPRPAAPAPRTEVTGWSRTSGTLLLGVVHGGGGRRPTAAPGSAGGDRLREGQGDRVGREAAVALLVEAVEAEDRGVDHVGAAGEGEVGGGPRDAGAPHHSVARGRRDGHAVDRL